MNTKICSKCLIEKSVDEFHKSTRDGYRSRCKPCKKEDDMIWRSENKEKDLYMKKKWREENKEYVSIYYVNNKDHIDQYNRDYYLENREDLMENSKNYYDSNKDHILDRTRQYYYDNKEKIYSKKLEYSKKHYRKMPHLYAHRNILKRHLSITGVSKSDRTHIMLGYTSEKLREHIESLFVDGMTWDNYGEWHIDHIKPISKFNKDESPSVVNALSNLQPLWAFENLSKGARYE